MWITESAVLPFFLECHLCCTSYTQWDMLGIPLPGAAENAKHGKTQV